MVYFSSRIIFFKLCPFSLSLSIAISFYFIFYFIFIFSQLLNTGSCAKQAVVPTQLKLLGRFPAKLLTRQFPRLQDIVLKYPSDLIFLCRNLPMRKNTSIGNSHIPQLPFLTVSADPCFLPHSTRQSNNRRTAIENWSKLTS